MIDIITHFDTNHKCLYDIFFKPSYIQHLSNNFSLIDHYADALNTDDSFQSYNWSHIIINRFNILKDYVKHNTNKWAIFSDIDMVFFDNINEEISGLITKEHNVKIFYMSENIRSYKNSMNAQKDFDVNPIKPQINGGFFLFLCCEEIYEWFTYIVENISQTNSPNDQTFIQNIINKSPTFTIKFKNYKILYSILNTLIFAKNNNFTHEIINSLTFSKVFHATSSSGIIEKMQILSSVYCKKKSNNQSNLWI